VNYRKNRAQQKKCRPVFISAVSNRNLRCTIQNAKIKACRQIALQNDGEICPVRNAERPAAVHNIDHCVHLSAVDRKPGKLSKGECEEIRKHPKITRVCLQDIKGFEEITKWASNHHEKLDGSGYPEGLIAKDLDFNSRLIACLDIYQALREERPYRKSLDHNKAIEILKSMAEVGQLDHIIVADINSVFSNL
jgi:HD-GYP domain-containing protein (c-di-GMP phosphodiesterase class II)